MSSVFFLLLFAYSSHPVCSDVTRIEFIQSIPPEISTLPRFPVAFFMHDSAEITDIYGQYPVFSYIQKHKFNGHATYAIQPSQDDFKLIYKSFLGKEESFDKQFIPPGFALVSWREKQSEYSRIYSPQTTAAILMEILHNVSSEYRKLKDSTAYMDLHSDYLMTKGIARFLNIQKRNHKKRR